MAFDARTYNIEEWLGLEKDNLLHKVFEAFNVDGKLIERRITRTSTVPTGEYSGVSGKKSVSSPCILRTYTHTGDVVTSSVPIMSEWTALHEASSTGLSEEKLSISGDISGTFSVSGLSTAGKVTTVSVGTSWTPIPATPLSDRNAISIQNQSGVDIKINYNNSAGYEGILIKAGYERYYDIKDSIVVYARIATGSTNIVVEELS